MKTTDLFPHESAVMHVTGEARYVNDMPEAAGALTGRVVYSPYACARIISFDLSEAELVQGVCKILSYKDIPGENQLGAIVHDEPCLAVNAVKCIGQAVFLIAAETEAAAIEAEKKIIIQYHELEAVTDLETAISLNRLISPPKFIGRGDVDKTLEESAHRIKGELRTGAPGTLVSRNPVVPGCAGRR